MTTTSSPKQERIGARVPHDVFETLHRAAELSGATLNQFLVEAALKEAVQVIEREQRLSLSRKDAELLLNLLDNPPLPNEKLTVARQRYRELKNDADSSVEWKP